MPVKKKNTKSPAKAKASKASKTSGKASPKAAKAPAAKKAKPKTVTKKKPAAGKKSAAAKPAAKSAAKPAAKKAAKAAKTTKPAAKKKPAKPAAAASAPKKKAAEPKAPAKPVKVTGFLRKQRQRLLDLKDALLDSMNGVARDSLRSRAEGSEASAFGMHQADAGSDSYDRDFALSLLSQEQDSLYEIDEALKRIDGGEYGICEMSGKPIPHVRLEARPFTRYTVECQAEIEKNNRYRARQPTTSLFGLSDGDSDDDDSSDGKD